MGRKRYTVEAIFWMLREAETELAGGSTVKHVPKRLRINEQTNYRWRKESGGLGVDQAGYLKEFEGENARLTTLVGEQAPAA
ncbi:MAG TPA: transposase [Acidobacteriota bacterium]|nr:transposase [Acidobacteriota bacterium]